MEVQGHVERAEFAVTGLGKKNLIVGEYWLKAHNPEIDWQTGKIKFSRCPRRCDIQVQEEKRSWKLKRKKKRDDIRSLKKEVRERLAESADKERILMVMIGPKEEEAIINNVSQELAIKAEKKKIKKSFEDIVPIVYHQFKKVFDKDSFNELPPKRPWDHAIELKPGSKPYAGKVYNLTLDKQKQLESFLDDNMQSGCIRPSKSPMAAPFFFIKKKSGESCPIQDYRKRNDMTIKNSYPLPLISELIDKLKGAHYFTKLDIRWGYNNVHIQEGDEWKAAFITNKGLFKPLVMFFGLTNSPATFQTMMNHIFRELIAKGRIVVYMDDILIFTATLDEHREIVAQVLQILQDNKLYLKPEKCDFEQAEIDYLGLKIAFEKIMMDPVKVQGVADWPQPQNVTDVRSFLGFTSFYRRFIQAFGDIAKPLNALLTKDSKCHWDGVEADAFEALKHALCSQPVLVMPDETRSYLVEADSSGYATGAVLSQMRDDDKWHPVAFISKGLSPAEHNYDIYDKEMLAIIRALEQWCHYLEGSTHPVQVLTDHKNLE